MTDLQFLPKPSISSNSRFFYADITTREKEHRIKLGQDKLEIRHNEPVHVRPHLAKKEIEGETYSAFDKAVNETYKSKAYHTKKRKTLEKKRKVVEKVVIERNIKIKETLAKEKEDLEQVLVKLIKDALKFTKENTPMISMMPSKITNVINQIKEDRRTSVLNTSTGSLNLSLNSNASARSIAKYESNQFLKALGLDLTNLNPKNIKIDIDRAYTFIQKWKVNKEDLNKVIRYKVVNEIMNVEERRSVQRIEKINRKINCYLDRKSKEKAKKENVKLTTSSHNDSVLKTKNSINTSRRVSTSVKRKSVSKSVKAKTRMSSLERPKPTKIVRTKKIVLNAYKNIDKLVKYVNRNETLRENEPLVEHFNNIMYNKKIDDMTRRMLYSNRIDIQK